MTIKKYRTPKYFEEKAMQYAGKYALKRNEENPGWNDEIDAFRHAYMQAYITINQGKKVAKIIGDVYEKWGDYNGAQDSKERNMDLWNNEIGRLIGEEVKNETSHFHELTRQNMYEDMIAEKIYKRMKKGDMITNPRLESRKYPSKGKPTGYASQVAPFSRQQIGRMKSEEFAQSEKIIMQQLRNGEIWDETNVKSRTDSQNRGSANGKWVTINGNHVLIKD